jgi:hypothetical protein
MRRVRRAACALPALAALLACGATVAAAATAQPVRVVTVRDARILESSGLVVSPTHQGLAWTVNDSGSGAVVYGVSTRTGATRAVLRVRGVDFRDTEAMAAATGPDGRGLLWVGDIGDNNLLRDSVVLRLVREPRRVSSTTVTPVSIRLRYPEGRVDAETLVWTADGRLLVVTKELLNARVLQVPPAAVRAALRGVSTDRPVLALPVATVTQSLVTDGGALPDGRVVLRGYGDAIVYAPPANGRMEALERLTLPSQPQGETLAVERGGASVLVGSEGKAQPLWRVRVPSAPASTPTTATATPSLAGTRVPRPPAAATRRTAWWLAGGGLALVSAVAVTGARRRGRRRR